MTPIGAIARGTVAGLLGTAAMDILWYSRYRRGGGASGFAAWETAQGVTWEDAPAPAQVGRRVVEGLFQVQLPDAAAPLATNVVHWAYGAAWGAALGVVEGSLESPRAWHGLAFGPAVWTSGYVVLPLAKLYRPMWEYDAKTLWKDLSAHLVYGLTAAAVFRALSRP